eukprot:1306274-Rhodomonas_salina.2
MADDIFVSTPTGAASVVPGGSRSLQAESLAGSSRRPNASSPRSTGASVLVCSALPCYLSLCNAGADLASRAALTSYTVCAAMPGTDLAYDSMQCQRASCSQSRRCHHASNLYRQGVASYTLPMRSPVPATLRLLLWVVQY